MIEHKRQRTFEKEVILELGTDFDPNVLAIMGSRDAVQTVKPWILDSGACYHVCNSLHGMKIDRHLEKGALSLRMGNGSRAHVCAIGAHTLDLPNGKCLFLKECYYIPTCIYNIVSISCLDLDGYYILTGGSKCNITYKDEAIGNGHLVGRHYILKQEGEIYCNSSDNSGSKRPQEEVDLSKKWHMRLGHISEKRLERLAKDGLISLEASKPLPPCEPCLKGKMPKSPFDGVNKRADEICELIHTDVCGPMNHIARGGYPYFITFTDDKSRYGYVYLMKNKSESFEKFKEFKNEVELQTGKKIKILRSDRGGEYLSAEFTDFLKDCGILSQWTPPGTPQLNGVSERRNRTLMDMVRSMMSYTDMPITFWGYALETAAYLLNLVPTKSAENIPHEMFVGTKPSLKHLRVWGCPAYVKTLEPRKLDNRSERCRFVGYPKETYGYQFYHVEDQKLIVSKHAHFLEEEFVKNDGQGKKVDLVEEATYRQGETT